MQSHHESGRLPRADPCLRCGLSVFREIDDVLNQHRLMPRLGNYIFAAQLSPEHGKADYTKGHQPSHTTWWPYESVDRLRLFEFVQKAE